jgi:hypothetical protein
MALNVTIINNLGSTTVYSKKKATPNPVDVPIIPYEENEENKKIILLEDQDELEIYNKKDERFQIGFRVEDGQPSLNLTRVDNKWIVKNIGTNTQVEVDVGPDGQ